MPGTSRTPAPLDPHTSTPQSPHQHPPIPTEPLGLAQAAPAAAHPLQGRGQLPTQELPTQSLIPSHFVFLPLGAMLSKAQKEDARCKALVNDRSAGTQLLRAGGGQQLPQPWGCRTRPLAPLKPSMSCVLAGCFGLVSETREILPEMQSSLERPSEQRVASVQSTAAAPEMLPQDAGSRHRIELQSKCRQPIKIPHEECERQLSQQSRPVALS